MPDTRNGPQLLPQAPAVAALTDCAVSQRAALDKVLAEIDAQFGKGSIMRLGDAAGIKARAAAAAAAQRLRRGLGPRCARSAAPDAAIARDPRARWTPSALARSRWTWRWAEGCPRGASSRQVALARTQLRTCALR